MALSSILSIIMGFLVILIIILAITYFVMSAKEKQEEFSRKSEENKSEEQENSKEKTAKSYTKESIFNFMEFEKNRRQYDSSKRWKEIPYGNRVPRY